MVRAPTLRDLGAQVRYGEDRRISGAGPKC
jgi:hypothetical protein